MTTEITNPNGVFGESVFGGVGGRPVISVTTTTIAANSVVCLSSTSTTTSAPGIRRGVAAADPLVFGIADAAIPVGGSGIIITEGFHLVAVSSDAVPAVGDFLVVSTSTVTLPGGTVKTSTASTPIGTIIGQALSTALDASGTFIRAYIKKM